MVMWTALRLRKGERFENHAQFEPFVARQHLLGQSLCKCVAVASNELPARELHTAIIRTTRTICFMYFFLAAHAPSAFFAVSIVIFQRAAPRSTHGRHVKDEHVNDVAQNVAQDVTQDVLGAAEDGSMKAFVGCPSSSGGTHAQHTRAAPRAALGRHVKDEHVKDAAQDVAEDMSKDVPQDVTKVLAFWARAARALLATPHGQAGLSTLTSRATPAHPTSPRSTGFCAIWGCISSSSSSSSSRAPTTQKREISGMAARMGNQIKPLAGLLLRSPISA